MSEKKSSFDQPVNNEVGLLIIAICIIGFIMIPAQNIFDALSQEQSYLSSSLGVETQNWLISYVQPSINAVFAEMQPTMNEFKIGWLNGWITDRVYALSGWISLIIYRSFTLMMWGGVMTPLFLAVAIDAYFVREISKSTFSSQSPLRHNIGNVANRIFFLAAPIWIIAPIGMPIFLAPSLVMIIIIGLWFWISNMQKRV
jgi:hypothetical protein